MGKTIKLKDYIDALEAKKGRGQLDCYVCGERTLGISWSIQSGINVYVEPSLSKGKPYNRKMNLFIQWTKPGGEGAELCRSCFLLNLALALKDLAQDPEFGAENP